MVVIPLWKEAMGAIEVVRLTHRDEIRDLVCLFEEVAQEQNWQPGSALDSWEPRSMYFALHEVKKYEVEEHAEKSGHTFIGGLQLVQPDGEGRLPCYAVWPEVPVQSRSVHVAILALEPASRGQSLLFWRLAIEMWRYCVGQGTTSLYIEVTPRVLPIYRRLGWPLLLPIHRRLGWPLRIVGEKRLHWGEECYLCTLGIPEVAQVLLQRAQTSRYYREIVSQAFRVTLSCEAAGAERITFAA